MEKFVEEILQGKTSEKDIKDTKNYVNSLSKEKFMKATKKKKTKKRTKKI